jgi:hypothetical protein
VAAGRYAKSPANVAKDDHHLQEPKRRGDNDEHVDGRNALGLKIFRKIRPTGSGIVRIPLLW